uniref:Uncharacterized protein n=1 Tax=Magnetococcus massalia (strain MO-1) TaxID=451514 RepID=A0A1S7LMP0_MAGMO|nr:Exported protein of unknown function [Candidatus Magnetococcus massalia]
MWLQQSRSSLFCLGLSLFALGSAVEAAPKAKPILGEAIFAQGRIQVIAQSAKKQTQANAQHQARLAAQRALARAVGELPFAAEKSVADLVRYPQIAQGVQQILRGAKSCGHGFHSGHGQAWHCLRLSLAGEQGVRRAMSPITHPYQLPAGGAYLSGDALKEEPVKRGLRLNLNDLKKMIPFSLRKEGAPQGPVDGVVIDVRALPYTPTLYKRLVDPRSWALYDPRNVEHGVWLARGSGGHAYSMGSAKAELRRLGSANPLVIKGEQVTATMDLMIRHTDAQKLQQADDQNGFLRKGRLVYLLEPLVETGGSVP